MCFIWLSQKGLHEWTFPASAIRGVRYCVLMGILSFPLFFCFPFPSLQQFMVPLGLLCFGHRPAIFLWIGFFEKLPFWETPGWRLLSSFQLFKLQVNVSFCSSSYRFCSYFQPLGQQTSCLELRLQKKWWWMLIFKVRSTHI